jgi:hypothetical protein
MISIQLWRSYEYVEVFRVGSVKTESIGFAHRDRPRKENEIYASIHPSLFRGRYTAELELLEGSP